MIEPAGVIFDMDGVLVASGPAHRASWQLLARRHAFNVSDEDFDRTFGRTSRDIIRLLAGRTLSDAEVRTLDDEKEALYRELVRGVVPLMIGARETLEALRSAGLALAVATSGPRDNVELVLTETGIATYFSGVVHGGDIERGKPAPDCFLLAAERLRRLPARCVVVEDAPVGIEAARAAGMRVVALVGTHGEAVLRAAGADRVVERLAQITPELVAALVAV
ncbi:MAG: Fructose-1-phosphate phosphatase YqaB [Phycisphaerae bacterium]|nr:Fructose-1-phosphate phosphatase YqaB [Phycisphaerae bacterium]